MQHHICHECIKGSLGMVGGIVFKRRGFKLKMRLCMRCGSNLNTLISRINPNYRKTK